jgi:cephalosporin-C deacetylase-like acetyl esterase
VVKPLLAALLLLAQATPKGADLVLTAAPDRAGGVYEPGATVTWTVQARSGSAPAAGKVSYVLRKGGLTELSKGDLDLVDGKATVTGTRAEEGTLLLELRCKPEGGKEVVGYGAAAFAPERIRASAPVPDDFDAFWKAKLEELTAVPANPQLVPVDVGDPNLEYWKITLGNIRGTRIHGQLAKPKGKSGLPALLQVQWAGVYGLPADWVLGHAREGWLSMNISAHDLPIDEKESFYQEKAGKELNDYPGQGNDDREKSYFLRMFLSCHRAVQYLTERPDWNRKTVLVHGGSQGGYQAFVAAGLHPAVTAFAANVPAGCDHTGKQAGRAPGWPQWAGRTWQGKDAKKMLETARYFDAMNFATRTKAEALVGIGLIDTVCPAEGVFATVNQLAGKKEIVIMPMSGHGGAPGHGAYYARFKPFLDAHRTR